MSKLCGSCLCENYRFEIAGPLEFLKNCHCSRCRKMSGSTFLTLARGRTDGFRVLSGADALLTYRRTPNSEIAFCKRCGSLVPYPPPGSLLIEFGAGLLDDDPGIGVAFHIYVASRAPWCELRDDLPKYAEQRTRPELRRG